MKKQRLPAAAPAVGIRALRQEAARYVRRAADGHRIVVTVAGNPVAMLGPVDATGAASLADLVAVQAVIAPRRREPIAFDDPVAVFSGSRLDRLLREIR
jgi:prevent-host-death family protein